MSTQKFTERHPAIARFLADASSDVLSVACKEANYAIEMLRRIKNPSRVPNLEDALASAHLALDELRTAIVSTRLEIFNNDNHSDLMSRYEDAHLVAETLRRCIELLTLVKPCTQSQTQPKIDLPPGSLMSRIAEILVSKKRFERDCIAALADWHEEYFEALDQERGKAKMASIRVRHTWAFFKAAGWMFGLETAGKLMAKLLGKIGSA